MHSCLDLRHLLLSLALPLAAGPTTDQNVRLSDPFPFELRGRVYELAFSPDASRIVYRAKQDQTSFIELYSVRADGSSEPQKLNLPGHVRDFLVTPDGTTVVYRLDGNIFGVPIDGGTVVRLNDEPVNGGRVLDYRLTADSSTVVYRADQNRYEKFELFSAPIDLSDLPLPRSINISFPTIADSGDVLDFVLSEDSSRAVYRADADGDSDFELFSTLIGPSLIPPRRLHADVPTADTGVLDDYAVSADASRVVFRADFGGSTFDLYSAPIDASSNAVVLNAPPLGIDAIGAFQVSGDSTRVAFLSGQGQVELYSVPIVGSAVPVRLNDPLVAGGSVRELEISLDSTRVAYRADQTVQGQVRLYSAPLDGSAGSTELTPSLVTGGNVAAEIQISPDSSRAVYRADQTTNDRDELYSVPLDGSALPARLNAALVPGGNVLSSAISSNSARVVYLADQDTDQLNELYCAPIDGGPGLVKLNAPVFQGVTEFAIGADSLRVAHIADQDAPDLHELYSQPLAGGPQTKLNGPLAPSATGIVAAFELVADGELVVYSAWTGGQGGLFGIQTDAIGGTTPILGGFTQFGSASFAFDVAPDGGRIVYRAVSAGLWDLYSVPVAGGTVVKVNGQQNVNAGSPFTISADSRRVVYRSDRSTPGTRELFSAPIDGSLPPIRLNSDLPSQGDVFEFTLSPDSSRVVYRADQNADNVFELFSLPADGSGPPVRLNAPLVDRGDVRPDFLIAADSSRVVYRADQDTDDINELYSVPLDGSAAPVRLSGTMAPGGDVAPDFRISSDSRCVVYRADPLSDEVVEAFVAPIDGTAEPMRVSGDLVAGGDVVQVDFSAEASHVVYLADGETDGVEELFSRPVDLSAEAIKLNSTPPPGGRVGSRNEFSGMRVVYGAQLDSPDVRELYSRPVDGSLPQVKLNGELPDVPPGQISTPYRVPEFQVTPDGNTVVYRSDQDLAGVFELYQVPIDGGGAPIKLNPPLARGQNVQEGFSIARNGSRVLYLANQEFLNAPELFRSLFQPELVAISPREGSAAGGNEVTLTGEGFSSATAVSFAGQPASSVTFVSSNELRVVVPRNLRIPPPRGGPPVGKLRRVVVFGLDVDVRVSNGELTSTLANGYTYLPKF